MIKQTLQRHKQFLEHVIKETDIPAVQIRNAMHYSLFPGGKRIRPLLVYLTGELIDVELPILDVISAAIELTHCYSLIHDDLPAMDDDDLRRGKPSCHKAFDEATAILTGDGMQVLAVELLLTRLPPLLPAAQVIAVTQELVTASGVSGMISGQSLDLSELAKTTLTETELRRIHQLKTGTLISACIKMVLAAKPELSAPLRTSLLTYAEHIGLVFQMQDDYLDRYAASTALGKGRSSDLANQKTTYASLLPQHELEQEIATHYEIALNELDRFDNKNSGLIELTRELQQRTNA